MGKERKRLFGWFSPPKTGTPERKWATSLVSSLITPRHPTPHRLPPAPFFPPSTPMATIETALLKTAINWWRGKTWRQREVATFSLRKEGIGMRNLNTRGELKTPGSRQSTLRPATHTYTHTRWGLLGFILLTFLLCYASFHVHTRHLNKVPCTLCCCTLTFPLLPLLLLLLLCSLSSLPHAHHPQPLTHTPRWWGKPSHTPLSLFAFFHLSVFLLFCSVRSGEADRPHSTGRPRRPFLTRLSFTPLPHPSVSSFQPTNAPRSPCCLFTCPFTFIFSESGLTPSQTG